MLYKLLYISRAVGEFSDADLQDLLAVSRRNNDRLKLTGLLVYANGQFLQVLEGDKEEVLRLYETISRDERNTDNRIVSQGPIADRMFPAWTMAFQNLDKIRMTEFGDIGKMVAKGFYSASAENLEPFVESLKSLL